MSDADTLYEKYKIRCEGSGTPGSSLSAWERRCQMCNKHYMHARQIPDHYRLDVLRMIDDGAFDRMPRELAHQLHRIERQDF